MQEPHREHCERQPYPDPDGIGSRGVDPWIKHVCEHVAAAVTERRYFTACRVRDDQAVHQLRNCCRDCQAAFQRDRKPSGARWAACDACIEALSLKPGWRGLDALAPRPAEEFEPWHARVAAALPHVPTEIAREWIHRHWGDGPYQSLPLLRMRFVSAEWPLSRVETVVVGRRLPPGANLWAMPDDAAGDWLASYMRQHRTWPTPIVVLVDTHAAIANELHPLQLLEGHHRLAYLKTLAAQTGVLERHLVWEVSFADEAV